MTSTEKGLKRKSENELPEKESKTELKVKYVGWTEENQKARDEIINNHLAEVEHYQNQAQKCQEEIEKCQEEIKKTALKGLEEMLFEKLFSQTFRGKKDFSRPHHVIIMQEINMRSHKFFFDDGQRNMLEGKSPWILTSQHDEKENITTMKMEYMVPQAARPYFPDTLKNSRCYSTLTQTYTIKVERKIYNCEPFPSTDALPIMFRGLWELWIAKLSDEKWFTEGGFFFENYEGYYRRALAKQTLL